MAKDVLVQWTVRSRTDIPHTGALNHYHVRLFKDGVLLNEHSVGYDKRETTFPAVDPGDYVVSVFLTDGFGYFEEAFVSKGVTVP